MRAPRYWYERPGVMSTLMAPVGAMYAAATARRVARPPEVEPGVPVICIGNLNAGGTGKTPTAIFLAQRLVDRGLAPHVVTRGYGGAEVGPHRVDIKTDSADRVGDEALLLAAFAPTWVAKDRAAGARAAEGAGAEVVLLDDGFQNPAVAKALSVVVVDAQKGFGNGLCIPAGPLREPVAAGLKRADLLLSIGSDGAQEAFATRWGEAVSIPHLRGRLEPLPTGMPWRDLPVLAFAGIGHPEKFFATLQELGANVLHAEPLTDHQPLTNALMTRLAGDAKRLGAQLVTTEKDAVRLPAAFKHVVLPVPVRLVVDDPGPLEAALDRILPQA
ncbi:tetraacyldisaccharide 4'-kinase [Aestuariibius sp. 2305UL40-4]|uniref:tetraacyldisaccharide 4'-kinase n=1 Tax=Aestuariibius violaceus TaxID=3234132 RepID=UPI00345E2B64